VWRQCNLFSNYFGHWFFFSFDLNVLVLFAFVVLGLVSSVLRQEIGWEERLQNDLFYVEQDVKTLTKSIKSVKSS